MVVQPTPVVVAPGGPPGGGPASTTTTNNIRNLSEKQLAARDSLRQAKEDLQSLKDKGASPEDLAAQEKVLRDAQVRHDTLQSLEAV